eukprot:s169_g1.t1
MKVLVDHHFGHHHGQTVTVAVAVAVATQKTQHETFQVVLELVVAEGKMAALVQQLMPRGPLAGEASDLLPVSSGLSSEEAWGVSSTLGHPFRAS